MGSNPVAQDSRKDALELKTRHAWSSVILTAGVTSKLLQYFINYNFVVLKLMGQKNVDRCNQAVYFDILVAIRS